jgi:hypothetical protein
LALTVVGVVLGWLTVEPWWAVGGFAVGRIVAVVTARR